MYRYFFRFCVMALTILTANLITGTITSYMIRYKNHTRPLVFTLVAMMIAVVIFYPLFIKLESWVKDISLKAIKSGKHVGGKYLGLIFTFIAGMLVLLYFYAKMWYGIDLLQALFQGNIGLYT
jgi:hypothetical protein